MRDTWKAARVGLLIVAALGAAFWVYRYVEERTGGEGYTLYAMFDDVQGLVEKSRVVIAGIPVGYIDRIRLVGDQARVDIAIREDVAVFEDGTVTMRSVSLLGESILVISPGSPDRRRLVDGDQIRVLDGAVTTDDLMRTIGDISENIRDVSVQLQRAFGTDLAGQRMEEALRNLAEALAAINRTIQQNEEVVGRTLENVETITDVGGDRLLRILENVEVTTRDVREIVSGNKEGLDRATGAVDDTVLAFQRAAEQIEAAASDVRQVTDRVARGEGTIGRLTADETLIDEVEGVVEGVGDFVGGIARLQTIVELRSEYNFLANTFKSYVSLRLQPREDRYYLLQLVDDPRGLTRYSTTTIQRSPPDLDEVPEKVETRITRSDALRFTLMFAKRIHFATFRFGILESTGGVGVDFHLFRDRLEMNTDFFAIGEQAFPRLRVRLAYEVLSRLWVLGGLDDFLNETRDFFLGAQLRFNDEDLKSILPFVPSTGVSN